MLKKKDHQEIINFNNNFSQKYTAITHNLDEGGHEKKRKARKESKDKVLLFLFSTLLKSKTRKESL